jgi:hypothetical protein
MPGAKTIIWTAENKAKLLDALVFYENIRVSDEVAQKVISIQ